VTVLTGNCHRKTPIYQGLPATSDSSDSLSNFLAGKIKFGMFREQGKDYELL
jgi:hypothetical protein